MSAFPANARVRVKDAEALDRFLGCSGKSYMDREGVVVEEVREGILRIRFDPREGGSRGANPLLAADLMELVPVEEAELLSLEERVARIEEVLRGEGRL